MQLFIVSLPLVRGLRHRRGRRYSKDVPNENLRQNQTKDHTVKNVLLVNALLTILVLSDTCGGRVHDKRIAEATPYPLPTGSRLLQDLGFLAFTLLQVEILMPTKKLRGEELIREHQRTNQALHYRRLRIEHVNQQCQALPHREKPEPPVEAGCP